MEELEYSPIPEWAARALEGFPTAYRQDIEDDVDRFRHVTPRPADNDGEVDVLQGVEVTHHIVKAPSDSEMIRWHYVDAPFVVPGRIKQTYIVPMFLGPT
jgi:hypothetical protein